ncbi:cellulase family glycosylhydrolase [Sphingomonas canadensis]|uniref:mannan endo-1,4-beta-mannosidase n=1 Tax=Sphingomonas canadensis TaxID=1219257 RepID=A0ABW3HFE4_9SPHN|nr:cellulase family glycosylhydrolase [Sphingomonas canadensis]MCW3838050.1 cellulase family glycosylhydrolase [Sphingomonas canadensis]
MVSRRDMLAAGGALAAALPASAAASVAPASGPFVRRTGTRFALDGRPYRFAGANIWYGAYLGAAASPGNRDRLKRELDRLAALGVTNLRLLASAEQGPLRNSVKPGFRGPGNVWNATLLDGLDFCLAEMGRRGMKAVLYLTNFWEWSGGMATYLYYVTGKYLDMGDPAHPWPAFPNATAQFYANPKAVALYHDWVRAIVGRTNAITGIAYAQDPAIMAWQLANEPRPGGGAETAAPLLPAFHAWIQGTARLIKSIDPNHLVSTGNEGLKGTVESADIYRSAHGFSEIDYLTAHIWPLNWSWIDAKDLAATNEAGMARVRDYIAQHVAMARELGKPLVIEEFGYPRDGGGYDPEASTRYRDAYYRLIYDAVEDSVRTGGPVQGSNFWAWNGEGRAAHGDHRYREGDPFVGDPPHEPQGWYGVFDGDTTTTAEITRHAQALATIGVPIAG